MLRQRHWRAGTEYRGDHFGTAFVRNVISPLQERAALSCTPHEAPVLSGVTSSAGATLARMTNLVHSRKQLPNRLSLSHRKAQKALLFG
jgi:hypothetical protein